MYVCMCASVSTYLCVCVLMCGRICKRMYEYMYSCKHDFGRACGQAWMYMTARACMRSYVCM